MELNLNYGWGVGVGKIQIDFCNSKEFGKNGYTVL